VPVDGLASVLVTEYHEGTKPALFIVRVSYGARRPHAYRYRFPQRRERPLLRCALPEARRPYTRYQGSFNYS
jgi:hypothetical protein